MTTTAPEYPQARTCPYHPAPGYDQLREGPALKHVTLYDGSTAWAVTGHAEARQLLADPRLSADRHRDNFPMVSERFTAFRNQPASFLTQDDPEHNRIRRMLISEFTVRRF